MSERISLFHGTTQEAAEQIAVGGWQARDLTGMVGELANRHEVPVAEVIDDLRRYNRFMLSEIDRGQVASFATRYQTAAGSWAQRAPEVEWDALWAIWRIKHSGQTGMYQWNLDVPGHAWVLDQMANQKLAVVEVLLTVDEMIELGATVGGFAKGPLTPELLPLLAYLPEVAFPLPFEPTNDVIVHQLERRVGWDVFAHWLGVTKEQFVAKANAGTLGPEGKGDFEQRPWWPLGAVDLVLDRVDAGISLDQL